MSEFKMKKFLVVAAVIAVCSATAVADVKDGLSGANSAEKGSGFTGVQGVTTVASVKALRSDSWVTLRGNIIERQSGDTYVFKDATGTINIDIDHKQWNGQAVGPEDEVIIQGEADKTWSAVDIEVKQITKVTK